MARGECALKVTFCRSRKRNVRNLRFACRCFLQPPAVLAAAGMYQTFFEQQHAKKKIIYRKIYDIRIERNVVFGMQPNG
jgi:hypothetical protein